VKKKTTSILNFKRILGLSAFSKGRYCFVSQVFVFMLLLSVSSFAQSRNSLIADSTILADTIVNTALGIQRSFKSLPYNVQVITPRDFLQVKDANFMSSLAGKVAGVNMNTSSSGMGASVRVVMRGTKSISGNNNALYVVDGIPLLSLQSSQPTDIYTGMGQSGDGISNLNPEDIESISILGGAAAALYGSDAANGVVAITTKRGNPKKLSVNFSNSTSFYSPFVLPRFQNTYGSETGSYQSWGSKLETPASFSPKDYFQTAYSVNNSVSISTGTEKNQTYASISSLKAEGIIHNNSLDRYNFTLSNSVRLLNDKLEIGTSVMGMKVSEQNMLSQGQYFNPLVPIYLFPRGDDIQKYQVFERYDPESDRKTQYWPLGNVGIAMQNPYWITERDLFVNAKDRYMFGATLKYGINKWLNIIGRAKTDNNHSINERKYAASTDTLFAGTQGAYYKSNYRTQQIYADLMINAQKTIKAFSIATGFGAGLKDTKSNFSMHGGDLLSVPNLFSYENLDPSASESSQTNYHEQNLAIFSTSVIGYKDRIFLDLTARNDWVSVVENTRRKPVFYPSAGISGIITDIFGIKSPVIPFLKARLSYSEVGNIPRPGLTSSIYPSSNEDDPTTAMDVKPERTKSRETGVNTMLWNNKIRLDLTLYNSSTTNQLFRPTASSGYSSFYVNAGRIENKGIELMLGLSQKIGPISWESGVIYSANRNKIKELLQSYTLPGGATVSMTEMDMGGTSSYRMILKEGGSMGDIYVNTLKTDEHGFIVVDYTSQSVAVDTSRWIHAGNANPRYTLGFRNSFEWKGWELSCLINARVGGVGVSITQALMDAYGVSEASALARDNGGVVVNGYKIPAQSYYQTVGGGEAGVGSMYVYSATNIRLAELSIGYEIPATKWNHLVKSINVSVMGRNLFMFYNKAPFDLESTSSTGTYYQGIDYFMQPSLRNIGFAIKVGF